MSRGLKFLLNVDCISGDLMFGSANEMLNPMTIEVLYPMASSDDGGITLYGVV